jgi:alpha-D-xyloside xylohydrolase
MMQKKHFLLLAAGIFLSVPQSCGWGKNAVVSWRQTSGKTVEITLLDGTLTITPQSANAIRVQFSQPSSQAMEELIFLPPENIPEFEAGETGKSIVVKAGKISAEIRKKTGAIAFKDVAGKVILQEQAGGRKMTPAFIQGDPTFIVEQRFDSPEDEYLYGMGQFQDGYLNIRGLPRQLRQVNTQISIPFLLSSKGYGLLWHNYGLVDFNPAGNALALQAMDSLKLNPNAAGALLFSGFTATLDAPQTGRYAIVLDFPTSNRKSYINVDGKTLYDNNYRWQPPRTPVLVDLTKGKHPIEVITQPGSEDRTRILWKKVEDETVFRSPVAQTIDYTVFAGTGDEAVAAYRELSGNAPMTPLWALGYIHCRERFHSQAELLENARGFRDRQLPVDVLVQDWQYWGKHGWNALKWDETLYPDAKSMIDELHAMNIKLMVSVWSRTSNSEFARQLAGKGYFLPGSNWVDFFNPDAAAFFWQSLNENLAQPFGIDAWWLDATEPEGEALKGIRINNGQTAGEVYLNVYPLLVNKTVYEGSRRDIPNKRVMLLTRSGFAGMQRYGAATWSGDVGSDWNTLKREIVGGLGQMASGLPWWTYDAGGFFRPQNQYTDTAYHRCFLRWLEAATFLPLQRVHGLASETEFWRYGETVETVARKYLDLRYRLLPYIYSEAAHVSFKGSTLMRPLVFDFAGDRKALEQKYQFMFGPSLLVAPVVEPDASRWNVYLPENGTGWIDFWTGEPAKDGTSIAANAALDHIPVYVRAGSIIPLASAAEYSTQKRGDAWEIRVYPGADASFTVYEDEGDNYNYERGQCATYAFAWDDAAQTLTIGNRRGKFDGMIATRILNIVKIKPGVGGIEAATPQKIVKYSGEELVVELK